MDNTENLALPYIMPSQSQKHVTHNEALRALDAVVQLAVADKDLSTPPSSPAPGARYIVGAGPTGAWSGHANDVAAWQDGAWAFYPPVAGWLAWVHDESRLYLFSGGGWTEAPGGGGSGLVPKGTWSGAETYNTGDLVEHDGHVFVSNTDGNVGNEPDSATPGSTAEWTYFAIVAGGGGGGDVNPVPLVGINDTADATNRLTVSSPASLFSHEGDHHRLKINKAAAGDTASVLFQTGFVGHAEFGLAGDNDWHVKVSPDGTTWHEAIVVNRATGAVSLPNTSGGGGGGGREMLTANRTYYVNAALGSDGNDGLASGAGAFATIQKAIDAAAGLDLGVYNVTIEVADGTYAPIVLKRCVGAGAVTITGNTGTPANCVIAAGSAVALNAPNVVTRYTIGGLRLTGTGYGIMASGPTNLLMGVMDFATTGSAQVYVDAGAFVTLGGNYTISSNAQRHWWTLVGGYVQCVGRTITLTGTPAFSNAFASCQFAYQFVSGNTFSGAATGTRYDVSRNGVIFTNGGGASYLPGNAAGTSPSGGQYL